MEKKRWWLVLPLTAQLHGRADVMGSGKVFTGSDINIVAI
jgi:hypothetical protein